MRNCGPSIVEGFQFRAVGRPGQVGTITPIDTSDPMKLAF
jgi:hypothetical protein